MDEKEREDEANTFGGEFLLPENRLEKVFYKYISMQDFVKLKMECHVSKKALIYRAGKLGAISTRKCQDLYKKLNISTYQS